MGDKCCTWTCLSCDNKKVVCVFMRVNRDLFSETCFGPWPTDYIKEVFLFMRTLPPVTVPITSLTFLCKLPLTDT